MSIIYSTQQDRYIDTDHEELEKVDYNWDIGVGSCGKFREL